MGRGFFWGGGVRVWSFGFVERGVVRLGLRDWFMSFEHDFDVLDTLVFDIDDFLLQILQDDGLFRLVDW